MIVLQIPVQVILVENKFLDVGTLIPGAAFVQISVGFKFQKIPGLTGQLPAQGVQCGKADGPRFVLLQDRQTGHSDFHPL